MPKKTTKRKLIGLVSWLTGHRIYTTVNKQTHPEKFTKRAYDPLAKQHADYGESKVNLGRNVVKARKS